MDVPLTTDEESSETAKLIENQGGGSPELIEDGGKVNVIHRSDLPWRLDYVSYDETGDWALVEPESFNEWKEKQNQKRKDGSNPTRNGREDSNDIDYSQMRINGFLYGLIGPVIINSTWERMLRPMMTDEMMRTEFYETVSSMIDFMVVLMAVIGFLMIIYSMIAPTIKGDYN